MKIQDLEKRLDEIISMAGPVLESMRQTQGITYVNAGLFQGFRASALSFLKTTFGTDHPYYQEFDKNSNNTHQSSTERGREILKAAKAEIAGGWIVSTKGLISAEIFSDFLEMANYLLSEGYKDAAAVMIGSVLEEHLRQLCLKNNIPIEIEKEGKRVPKKADTLNSELCGKIVYNKLDQKNVTAWLDLRNKAAHGKYSEYTKEQVELMYQAVADFMSRVAL